MVYRNNAGRLGAGFMSVCLKTRWLGLKRGFICRDATVGDRERDQKERRLMKERIGDWPKGFVVCLCLRSSSHRLPS